MEKNSGVELLEEQVMILVYPFNKPLTEGISLQDGQILLEMRIMIFI